MNGVIDVGLRALQRMDRVSAALLLLWTGMALGIAVLAAPAAFHRLPSRELAGQVIGASFRGVDVASWIAFGLAFLLSYGSRWLSEIDDTRAGVGPMRLWSAALMAALLMCFASAAIVNPKLEVIRSRIAVPIENLPPEHPDRAAFRKAHLISEQLLVLRMLLALGLAAGIAFLPREKEEPSEA
jgi:hypothetical protein